MTISHSELDRLSAQQRRELLADLLRRKEQVKPAAQPALKPDPAARYEPFPLTDVQYAYWLGQQGLFPLGKVATHAYLEYEADGLDVGRVERALNRLIGYHDMLRAVVDADGRQHILPTVEPYRLPIDDLRGLGAGAAEQRLLATRESLSHKVHPPDHWPLFEVRATIYGNDRVRLHISLSLLILDAWSIRILLTQWFALYDQPKLPLPALEISFRDYVLAEEAARGGEPYRRADAYWRSRLAELPPGPDLPLAADPRDIDQPHFTRLSRTVAEAPWTKLKAAAQGANFTPSGLLLSVFGSVLRRWSSSRRFVINATVFNRQPLHPQIDDLLGDFTSTMLLAFDGTREARGPGFVERAKRVQQRFWEDLDHCQYSGVRVGRDLMRIHNRGVLSPAPVVFTSIFGTSAPAAKLLAAGDFVYGISQTPQVWLDHQVTEQAGHLVLTWDVVEGLFPPELVEDMFDAYTDALDRLATDPSRWHDAQIVRLPQRQRRLRDAVNHTAGPVSDQCLHTLFEKAAERGPDRAAVVGSGCRWTFDEVGQRVRQLTARLLQAGARRGHPVGVVLPKGCDQAVAVLAVVRAGAAYLPIDPSWPQERVAKLLELGEADVVVTNARLAGALSWPANVQRITVDREQTDIDECTSVPPDPKCTDLAYVIFTSGSTGEPKGVMTDHRGAVNTILDVNERFGVGPDDRVLALSALHFDLSVYDIFGVLAAGGTVVFPEAEATRDPRRWVELIQQEGVTVWNTVPALMEMLVEHLEGRDVILHTLRLVLLSGDWIPVNLPDRIRRLAPNARVISLGGATEASIWSIFYPIDEVDPNWPSIPYGKPLRNQTWRVLNDELEDCPTWVAGDLYIGGIGQALGYWRDEDRTNAGFITHPVSGERLYRTGDRGRYLQDDNIEFLGRVDDQVKIRGHRIELGEVEAALAAHPDLHRVVVAAVGRDHAGRRLVGYVVPKKNGRVARADKDLPTELRSFVSARLPEYMVPATIVCLDELPLTTNGKVNRDALPDPGHARPDESSAPCIADSSLVDRVAALIATELDLAEVDPEANLMTLGADSVDMVRIANRIEAEFGFQPSLAEFFRNPTVAALAAAQERSGPSPAVGGLVRNPAAGAAPNHSTRLILDPAEREAFTANMPGLRRFEEGHESLLLMPDPAAAEVRALRRSWRTFHGAPLDAAALGKLLSSLARADVDGAAKYAYGSAGGLYPVQTYLHIKRGRVRGLDSGVYYHDPVVHSLVPLAPGANLDPEVHEPFINRGVFEQAAFSLFLIARLDAIEPLYGEHALRFATIEAGLMAQLLETSAPRHGIGLCQIGWIEFDRIRQHFLLDEGHHLVHSLLGGRLPDAASPGAGSGGDARATEDREEGEI